MLNVIRTGALCAALAFLGACATITRSPHTQWSVASEPAGAAVTTSTGYGCAETPCSILVRRKDSFNATVSLPGYQSQTILVKPTLKSGGMVAFLGNGIIGGLLGASIDIYTGSALDPSPNGNIIALTPEQTATGAFGAPILVVASNQSADCTLDRLAYARQVGVPCWALGPKVEERALSALATAPQRP